jgi:hypothetical protein
VHNRRIEPWSRTQNGSYAHDAKRIYYLCRVFLMEHTLGDSS